MHQYPGVVEAQSGQELDVSDPGGVKTEPVLHPGQVRAILKRNRTEARGGDVKGREISLSFDNLLPELGFDGGLPTGGRLR